jgi:hypothetical protein
VFARFKRGKEGLREGREGERERRERHGVIPSPMELQRTELLGFTIGFVGPEP